MVDVRIGRFALERFVGANRDGDSRFCIVAPGRSGCRLDRPSQSFNDHSALSTNDCQCDGSVNVLSTYDAYAVVVDDVMYGVGDGDSCSYLAIDYSRLGSEREHPSGGWIGESVV